MNVGPYTQSVAKQTYTSAVRTAAALETRAAILRAAGKLFSEQGFAKTTVAGIAKEAGVALNTVYTSVGGKPALIEALVEDSTGDEHIDESLKAVFAADDPRLVLRLVAEGTAESTRRHELVLNLLFDNITADPVVAAAASRAVERYRERLARVADHLVALGARTDRVRTEQILWFYFGRNGWRTVRELGWDWAEGAGWLADQAGAALLD